MQDFKNPVVPFPSFRQREIEFILPATKKEKGKIEFPFHSMQMWQTAALSSCVDLIRRKC